MDEVYICVKILKLREKIQHQLNEYSLKKLMNMD